MAAGLFFWIEQARDARFKSAELFVLRLIVANDDNDERSLFLSPQLGAVKCKNETTRVSPRSGKQNRAATTAAIAHGAS